MSFQRGGLTNIGEFELATVPLSIANDTLTDVVFNQITDPLNMLANNGDAFLTIPLIGPLLVTVTCDWASGAVGYRLLTDNGSIVLGRQYTTMSPTVAIAWTQTLTYARPFSPPETYRVRVRHTQGAALNLDSCILRFAV